MSLEKTFSMYSMIFFLPRLAVKSAPVGQHTDMELSIASCHSSFNLFVLTHLNPEGVGMPSIERRSSG